MPKLGRLGTMLARSHEDKTRRTTMPVLWNWARRRLRVSCSLIQAAHEKPLRRQVQKRAFGAQTDAEKEGIVYNACISACEKAGQWQHALALFQEMEGCRIPRTSITYNATISACEKGHEWERALRFVAEMEIFDVERCAITYNACIAACDEAGQWQHALLLLGDMSRNQAWLLTKLTAGSCAPVSTFPSAAHVGDVLAVPKGCFVKRIRKKRAV
eukprot:s345_g9.t3